MKLLMIAYYFPPDASSGSFRPFYFAKHFKEKGEQVYVLTAREEDFLSDQPKDHQLLDHELNLEIYRTRVFRPREAVINFRDRVSTKSVSKICNEIQTPASALKSRSSVLQSIKDFITFSLSSPDPHIGWLPAAVFKGLKLIREKKVDLIYATGSPWSCLIIGAWLKILTGKPLVLDFRDPWVSNPGFMVRNRFFRFLEVFMERFVVKRADLIVANTRELKHDFIERYQLEPQQVCAITNGFEKYFTPRPSPDGKFTLTHAGSLYFSRNPRNLLKAVLQLINAGVFTKNNFIINFIGGISIADDELNRLLANKKIQEVIQIIPRISFQDVCEYQCQSDVLFLIQTDFPLQVPRKLYENMAFGKPILAITNKKGATATIVEHEGVGIVVENNVEAIVQALVELFSCWEKKEFSEKFTQSCDQYLNHHLCQRIWNKFDTLLEFNPKR